MLLLVGQLLVSDIVEVEVHLGILGNQAPRLVGIKLWKRIRYAAWTSIGSQRIRQTELSISPDAILVECCITEEVLLAGIPSARDVPSGEPTALLGLTKLVGTLITEGTSEDVASSIRVATHSVVSHVAAITPCLAVVVVVLLNLLLEEVLVEERNVTVLINDTPALEALGVTLNLTELITSEQVNQVSVVERLVILCLSTQV